MYSSSIKKRSGSVKNKVKSFGRIKSPLSPSPRPADLDDLAHKLRTPLTVIKGNLDLMYFGIGSKTISPAVLKAINNINREIKVMSGMLNRLDSRP